MIRNPLASPDVLGITGGAAFAVVSFLAFFSDQNNALTVSIKWMPLAAFVGLESLRCSFTSSPGKMVYHRSARINWDRNISSYARR